MFGTKTVLPRKLLLFESYEKNICDFLAGMFQKAGFQTQVVSSVDACMEAVRTASPDIDSIAERALALLDDGLRQTVTDFCEAYPIK